MRKLLKNKKGVFGLNAVQSFFAIILGIALLAYVIVIIMGTLQSSTILSQSTGNIVNETGYINQTGYNLTALTTYQNVKGCSVTQAFNRTSGLPIVSANWTTDSTNCRVTNATAVIWNNASLTYTFTYDGNGITQSNSILSNTSYGISGFFNNISPVYAVMAVLVIILVLVVLVRIVQRPNEGSSPSL